MIIENFQAVRYSLVSSIGPTMVWKGEKMLKIKVIRGVENATLRLVFANTVLHKTAI